MIYIHKSSHCFPFNVADQLQKSHSKNLSLDGNNCAIHADVANGSLKLIKPAMRRTKKEGKNAKETPNMGLEPTTTRLKAGRSSN